MASVLEMSKATGYSREAIQTRIDRFDLEKPYDGRKIFDLRPLSEADERMTLEKARTLESSTRARKLQIEIESLERERINVEQLNVALSEVLNATRTVIDQSPLPQADKDQIIDSLATLPARLWGKHHLGADTEGN